MQDLKNYAEAHKEEHLEELLDLLRIPSVSTNPEHVDDVRRAGDWIAAKLEAAGITTTIYPTEGHPIVYGEWMGAGEDAPTVLVYGHYDVQPPDPMDLWETPPFEPSIRDGKIFARGATDDKGQMYAHIKAAEVHMETRGKLPVNVKYLIEGEEEIGSKNLAPFLEANQELLKADVVVISDTSMFAPGVPAIVYGLRGLVYMEVEVEGADHDLHSGLYGGAVANPINAAAKMIASLKDENDHITVPGFYDAVRPLTSEEREAWSKLPFDEEGTRKGLGATEMTGEAGYTTLERRWGRPTLDCNGFLSGFTGEGAKTVLPSKAMFKFSCRLVPDQDPKDIEDKLYNHLNAIAPKGIKVRVKRMHGGSPVIVDTNNPAVKAAQNALSQAFGAEAVFIRGGGSIPVVADFSNILNTPSVLMGFGLPDDRLHSPNEKFNLDCYYNGIVAASLFLEEYGKV